MTNEKLTKGSEHGCGICGNLEREMFLCTPEPGNHTWVCIDCYPEFIASLKSTNYDRNHKDCEQSDDDAIETDPSLISGHPDEFDDEPYANKLDRMPHPLA